MVTGGENNYDYLTNTEIQISRFSAWREVASYPHYAVGLKGATINNVVYMTGERI